MVTCKTKLQITRLDKSRRLDTLISGEPLTPEQQQFIDTINEARGLASVAWSVEEVEEALPKRSS